MLKKMGSRRINIKNRKPVIIGIIITLLFFLPIYITEKNIKPTIKRIAEAKANLIATEAINFVIYEDVLNNIEYRDLVNIHKDTENKVTLIQANSIQISRIITESNLKIKDALNSLKDEIIEIPLGQALGSYLFAAYGPKIKVKLVPVGEIDVGIQQDFHEAGINQTRHMIYLDINTTVQIIIPLATDKISVSTKTPIAETIIVGTVPNTVVQLEGLNKFLNGDIFSK